MPHDGLFATVRGCLVRGIAEKTWGGKTESGTRGNEQSAFGPKDGKFALKFLGGKTQAELSVVGHRDGTRLL